MQIVPFPFFSLIYFISTQIFNWYWAIRDCNDFIINDTLAMLCEQCNESINLQFYEWWVTFRWINNSLINWNYIWCCIWFDTCSGEFRRKFVGVLDRCRCNQREIHSHHSLYLNAAATRLQTISPNTRSLYQSSNPYNKSFREKQVTYARNKIIISGASPSSSFIYIAILHANLPAYKVLFVWFCRRCKQRF